MSFKNKKVRVIIVEARSKKAYKSKEEMRRKNNFGKEERGIKQRQEALGDMERERKK